MICSIFVCHTIYWCTTCFHLINLYYMIGSSCTAAWLHPEDIAYVSACMPCTWVCNLVAISSFSLCRCKWKYLGPFCRGGLYVYILFYMHSWDLLDWILHIPCAVLICRSNRWYRHIILHCDSTSSQVCFIFFLDIPKNRLNMILLCSSPAAFC